MKSKAIQTQSARGLLLASLALSTSVRAADVYWDIDGATGGAGGTSPAGTWSTAATNWSTDSTGSSATQVWADGDSAIFSAGTNATGQFNVTNGGVIVDNITQEQGRVRITTGTLTLADTSMIIDTQTRVSGDYDLRIDTVVANSGAGASSLTKNGAGILLFTNAANSFSGGITLNAGTLAVETTASNTALGTGTLTLAGGTFVRSFANAGVHINTANTLSVTGNVKVGAIQQNNGNWVLSGAWGAGSLSGNFNISNLAADYNGIAPSSTTIKVQGDMSAYLGTVTHNNLASGGNRLRFGADNAGSVTLNASGTRFFTSGSTTGANGLDFADGTYGTFRMGELAGTGGRIRAGWSSGGNTTFEVGALNTSSKFAGLLDNNANGSNGLAALNKVGSGALELSLAGGNTYSGGTTVTAGSLLAGNITGSATGTGAVTVNGGRFGGTGIVAPTGIAGINVTSGVIAPGGAVSATTGGSFNPTVGNLTFALGGTTGTINVGSGAGFEFGLGTSGSSLASVGTGDLVTLLGVSAADFTFNGNMIDFSGTGAAGFYKLFDTSLDETTWSGLTFDGVTGLVSGGLTASNLASGLGGQFIVGTAGNGGDVGDIYLQAVPEPGSALLGGAGFLLLLRRRRA